MKTQRLIGKPLKSLTGPLAFAATMALAISSWAASPPTVLVWDTFDANTANTTDLNVDIARQTGTLAPANYTMAIGPGHYGHQLQNANAQNQLLVADFPNSTSSLNVNFNGANSAGGLIISFDLDSIPTVYGSTPDNWGCVNLGMAQADQLANVNQGVTHFGILLRGAGTIQAFDGAAVVSPGSEPVFSTRPAGTTNHIDLVITDADGNPFDGTGNTTIEVFANGGPLPAWSYTKSGGYANNYINVQGSFRAHFDNLTVSKFAANSGPVIANPSFEADTFAVFPGYVNGNGPITGWASPGGHGVNPGTFGGPFTDNGTIPDGTKAAFLQEDGALSQIVSGFSVGATYQIRYFENARNGGVPACEVKIAGNTIVAAHTVTPVGGANPYREVISNPFTATSSAMELAFIKSNPQGGDTTLLIDNVSTIAPGTPPSISVQPQDQTVGLGDFAAFTVVAAGSAPLGYQWYFGADPLADQTNPTLSVFADFPDVAGNYSVVVANSSGSITSRLASLTVRAKVPGLFNTGVDNNGVALADGAVDPHYQLVVNADSASLEAIVEDSTAFPIVTGPWVANTANAKWIGPRFDTSAAAGLAQGNGTYVYRTTFDLTGLDRNSVVITGGWAIDNNGIAIRINGTPTGLVNNSGFGGLTGFTINSLNAPFVDGVNTLEFEVQNVDAVAGYTGLQVQNLRGLAELPGTPPSISAQPQSQLAGTGESVTFSVVAAGSSPLTYQWRKGGFDIPEANNAFYTIPSVAHSDAGVYAVRVSNPAGTIVSADAVLTVRDTVPGVFNTGVDDAKAALPDGSTDTHYRLVVNPDSASPDTFVENSSGFPIVTGPGVANNAGSKWIGPRFDTTGAAGGVGDGGNYVYRTVVNLTGFEPASVVITGVWATDNDGVDILVNGQSTGQRNLTQFTGYTAFSITTGLLAGPNAIDFKLNNAAVGYTGLRVDQIRALGTALPPGTSPVIVQQPQTVTATLGERVTFTARANGSPPLEYQWYYGPDPLFDETNSTLSFQFDFPDQAGQYSVEIVSPFGVVHSSFAALIYREAPLVLTQPQSQVVAIGDPASFSVTANGAEPLSYQWQKNGVDISGANSPTYSIAATASGDAGTYTVRISNFAGNVTSAGATLGVLEVIPGVFNTGVDGTGAVLADGTVDPHYQLVVNPDSASPNTIVEDSTVFPIVTGPWVANGPDSKWIGPRFETSGAAGAVDAGGDYTYRTLIDVTGYDPATVRVTGEWSTDNEGRDILINGTSTGQGNSGQFVVYTSFSVTSGFQAGVNQLDFKLNNSAVGYTGLRVRGIRALGVRSAVNQAPSFTKGPDVTVAESDLPAAYPFPNWATNIRSGPAGEPAQALTFIVTSDNPTLLSAAINPANGLLSVTVAPHGNGVANVTVVLMDDGGTANGGVDSSAPQTFVVHVLPVNDCPVATSQSVAGDEDQTLPLTLNFADPDSPLTFVPVALCSHGVLKVGTSSIFPGPVPPGPTPVTGPVVINPGTFFIYVPNPDFSGTDSFSYKVDDGLCVSSVATVSITIRPVNDDPIARFTVSPQFDLGTGSGTITVLSANNSNACVTLDGSLSSDIEPGPLGYSWFLDASPVPFASGVIAGTCLEIGEHDVTLAVTDGDGGSGTTTVHVEVISAGEAVEELIAKVNDAVLDRKNKRPFIATLKAVAASFDRGNTTSAVNQLHAFQNKVRAQIGGTDPALASEWIRLAQAISDAVGTE